MDLGAIPRASLGRQRRCTMLEQARRGACLCAGVAAVHGLVQGCCDGKDGKTYCWHGQSEGEREELEVQTAMARVAATVIESAIDLAFSVGVLTAHSRRIESENQDRVRPMRFGRDSGKAS